MIGYRYILSALLLLCLAGCSRSGAEKNIEGMWISSEETSAVFPHGTRQTAIGISKEDDGTYTARGAFLWKGSYHSAWELVDLWVDQKLDSIIIQDIDGDFYRGNVDLKNMQINGAVYLENNMEDPLNFIKTDDHLESELFHPRLPRHEGEPDYSYSVPEQLDDGLQTANAGEWGLDPAEISDLIRDIIHQEYGRVESLLVLKDNKLIVEEYFYAYNRDRLHPIYSCTKSITSLLLGMALGEHTNEKVNQPLFQFFPQCDSLVTSQKQLITLEHVLTMTAGLQWDEFPAEMYETENWFHYILGRPMQTIPGEAFHYNSGCSILLGGVISSLVGMQANAYAKEALFTPLGISAYDWETHPDGTPQCGAGLWMLPRDMAKIGLLVLNNGIWNQQQLVSKEWILHSTTPHIAESEYFDYGYQWWLRTGYNKRWWTSPPEVSGREYPMIIALGWGGQFIIIVKQLNLVVITTASDYANEFANSKIPMVTERIIPMLLNSKQ